MIVMQESKKKKIAIIGTVGVPACYGGFETLAEHLVSNLSDTYDMHVYCTKKKYKPSQRVKTHKGAKLHYLPFDANGIQSIIYDTWSILHALFYADVLVVLGVAGAWTFPFIRFFTGKKIVVSIDGIEWKRGKWNRFARWYLWWAESLAVKYSHADIADNESIQDYTAKRYKTLSNIIEYGADHTMRVKPTIGDKEKYAFLSMPYACKVCRIEPENNVHVVLEAFSKLPRHTLVFIGNWNNSEYGRALREKYKDNTNMNLLDPIYDQRTLDVIRGNCFLYIHGHSAGGTNPSLVEAMYLGLPVIAFDVSYNRTTTDNLAYYFRNTQDLLDLVMNTRISQFKQNGDQMREIALHRYTWEIIAKKYEHIVKRVFETKKKLEVAPQLHGVSRKMLLRKNLGHLQHAYMFHDKV
ncbi:MAG: hypothetical protein RL204_1724 [Bacteroidota bacterium]|jgi:glycosyltransferase involved in cell wall biosynthesis